MEVSELFAGLEARVRPEGRVAVAGSANPGEAVGNLANEWLCGFRASGKSQRAECIQKEAPKHWMSDWWLATCAFLAFVDAPWTNRQPGAER